MSKYPRMRNVSSKRNIVIALKAHLDQSHSVLIANAPAVAERLLQIALDPNTKNYAAVSACQAVFAIIDKGVTDSEHAEQLREIRESLNALEGGRVIDL